MNNYAQKGFKPFVLRVAIIAVSTCYVFGPSHNEINKILHFLTHQLEMPDNVISHSMVHNDFVIHDGHNLKKPKEIHNHGFLKFLDKILKFSDSENDSDDKKVVVDKIDKHLSTKKYHVKQELLLIQLGQSKFVFAKQKIQKGFRRGALEPPQLI